MLRLGDILDGLGQRRGRGQRGLRCLGCGRYLGGWSRFSWLYPWFMRWVIVGVFSIFNFNIAECLRGSLVFKIRFQWSSSTHPSRRYCIVRFEMELLNNALVSRSNLSVLAFNPWNKKPKRSTHIINSLVRLILT
jgi:hypothetical protein